ncbi:MAG: hypothetical protein QOK16_4456 [Solirubrobacteraceae bacterium]|jgi:hypothetical protein|nr:hypothetical protein [Solirubrobacteraceae bacterium]
MCEQRIGRGPKNGLIVLELAVESMKLTCGVQDAY